MFNPPTMLFMTAITTTVGGLLLSACCRRLQSAALRQWAAAMLVASMGLVAAAANGDRVGAVHTLATAALLAASALFWTAMRSFRGVRPARLWIAAGPVAWLATSAWQSDLPAWAAFSCGIGALYSMASVREMVLARAEALPSLPLCTALMASHAAVYAARAALAGLSAAFPDLVATPDWVVPAMIAEAMVHINGTALVLASLLLERHEIRHRRRLEQAARIDGLTGIANRRCLDEHLDELARDRRMAGSTVALLLLDLDRFKSINDTAGHHEGDLILQRVARVIAGQVRSPHDLASRYGGEEFAVVLTSTTPEAACGVAERIRAAVESDAMPHPGIGGVVTLSIGVGVMPVARLELHTTDLIASADQALYEAKRRGRNAVVAADELEPRRVRYSTSAA